VAPQERQRALITAQRHGKVFCDIARAIAINHPECYLIRFC